MDKFWAKDFNKWAVKVGLQRVTVQSTEFTMAFIHKFKSLQIVDKRLIGLEFQGGSDELFEKLMNNYCEMIDKDSLKMT